MAFEEAAVGGSQSEVAEYRVVVRDLWSGRVLHRVPTGTPLKAQPQHVGVGNVVAILAKSDGAVAWIADDYGRSFTRPSLREVPCVLA